MLKLGGDLTKNESHEMFSHLIVSLFNQSIGNVDIR
jgi:hypothetical protein